KRFHLALVPLLLTAVFSVLCSSVHAQLYVSQGGTDGKVGEYNATTGAAINANFIPAGSLNTPNGLTLFGNTLLVADSANSQIGAYNATTGAAINASFITGLNGP